MLFASAPARTGRRRRPVRPLIAAMVAILSLGTIGLQAVTAATPVTNGYRDDVYGPTPGAQGVSISGAQSKLWFNDNRWFGMLFDPSGTSARYRIYRFDMATQNWTSTGVAVDDRNRSHGDALSDGGKLYVASSHATSDVRFYRYNYNSTTKAYTLSTGPKVIPNTSGGTLFATIAKGADGNLWIVFQQSLRIMYSYSTDDGNTWTAPAQIPGQLNDTIGEDTAAVTAVSDGTRNGIEVMWGNQNPADDTFHSAIHINGDPGASWQPVENVVGTPGSRTYSADNHINLKTDTDGQPIAAIKTGRDFDPSPNSSDPLIAVVKRTGDLNAAGSWALHPVTTVATKGTRPILQLDTQNNQANVFLTDPTLASDGSQAIYRRTAPLNTLNFGTPGVGTNAVIRSSLEVAINDATSTKQAATAASGMLILATNIPTRRYMHACIGDPCPVAPAADFTATPTTGQAPLNVQFTDTSTNSPTSWLWDFGDGSTSTAQNPTHQFAAGTWTVKLTATNLGGSDQVTKSNLIDVSPAPQNAFFAINPLRMLDTRSGNGLSGSFVANTPRAVQIAGRPGVPSDAIAVTGNLTVVGQTKPGYLSIGPSTATVGSTSSLNFPTGDTRANGVTVPLSSTGTTGQLAIVYKAPAGSKASVVFDVTGYFRTTTGSGDTFNVINPVRLLDSRSNNGVTGRFAANTPKTWQITGRSVIPATGVTAITANLTVVNQTKAGYVSIGPVATSSPTASTINFPTGDVRANGVTVKLNGSGQLSGVYKAPAGATTDLVLDVTGYFKNDGTGTRFVPLSPVRLLDTRGGNGLSGKFAANTARTWVIGGRNGVDPGAVAVVGNVTVVNQTKAGYVAVTPTPTNSPTTSTINFPTGDVRANGMTVKLTSGNLSAVYKAAAGATTDLVYDVFGYYQ